MRGVRHALGIRPVFKTVDTCAAEFEAHTLLASRLYADDVSGARHEAGDLIQAEVDWEQVHSIHQALRTPAPRDKPLFFKSVGSAAWDLAAARCALQHLNQA